MAQAYTWPPINATSSSPSTGNTGVPAPAQATEIGGVDGTGILRAIKVDASGELQVDIASSALPAGAATSANQVTEIASINQIDTDLLAFTSANHTDLVQIDTDLLAFTSANHTDLDQINTTLGSPAQEHDTAGNPSSVRLSDGSTFYKATTPADTQPISAVSLPLPTGAATETTLASIDGKLNSLGQKTSIDSVPVVLASDQSTIPISGSVVATQTTGTNLHTVVDSGTIAATQSGTWSTRTQDGSGNALTSHAVNSNRGVDQYALGFTSSEFIRNDYSSVNVTTGAYVQLIASTSAEYQEMEIFDSSGQTLKIAFGGSGSEIDKFLIYPGGNGRIKQNVPSGTRISIRAVSATASVGEIDLNLYG